jgi:energy-coupling factor transporter ATP-binding protein EcfA2
VCIRGYFARVAARMCAFAETHGSDKRTYAAFAHDAARHAGVLRAFAADLAHLTPFATTPAKAAEMGFVLHKYWRLHSDPDLDAAARFSFGFMAYSENMAGVYESLAARTTAFARFERGASTVFKEQYYPAHKDDAFVANSLSLRRNVLLSGPNASGKTTLLKSLCLNVIFSQQFGCGFYSSGVLDPYTHIHSYLNIPDSSGRDSLFQAESRRCKDIMDAVHANPKYRHLCIFDELYSGTNPAEATQAGYAFLRYICGFANVDFALTTHYVGICARLRRHPRVALRKMETRRDPVTRKLVYTYRMRHGVSRVLGAADVLEEMEYPKEIVDMVRKGGEAPL